MELQQLAFVLDYVDTSIHDTELLPAYADLIAALELAQKGDADAAIAVQKARELVVGLHEEIRPKNWPQSQLDILDSYDAQNLIGIPAIARVQSAFVDNFMNPKALIADMQALHDETLALAERVTLLLKGLDPVLTELPEKPQAEFSGAEIVDGGELRPMNAQPVRNPLTLIKNRLPNRNNSTALVRTNDVPLATKLMAAAPVVLAAAGKALEVYRSYSDAKQSLAQTKPAVVQQKPAAATPVRANQPGTSYVRYSYSRSVYITTRDDKTSF